MIRGEDGLRTIRAHLRIPATMEQNDVPTTNLLCDLSFDDCGGRRIPVVAGDIPEDRFEAQFARNAQDCGPAAAERRTEQIAMFAHGVTQSGVALRQFLSNLSFAFKDQQGMRESVVADGVAGLGDFAGACRTLMRVLADQKESSSCV